MIFRSLVKRFWTNSVKIRLTENFTENSDRLPETETAKDGVILQYVLEVAAFPVSLGL